jgi:hypothetical protein
MSTFGSNLDLHQNIGKALEQLNNGELSLTELEDLLVLAREQYERIIALRYKAFENEIKGASSNIASSADEGVLIPQKEEVIVPDSPPAIEFALFGEIQEQKDENIHIPISPSEDLMEEVSASETKVVIETARVEIEKTLDDTQKNVSIVQTTSGTSLLDRLSTNSSSSRLADQLKKSKIESIVSALTLNDKIRFTRNLFDGNSDTFNAAIQLLDAQKSVLEARDLLQQYASRYEWNLEDSNTLDFQEFIERRYA